MSDKKEMKNSLINFGNIDFWPLFWIVLVIVIAKCNGVNICD